MSCWLHTPTILTAETWIISEQSKINHCSTRNFIHNKEVFLLGHKRSAVHVDMFLRHVT
jgi:hypothetical protein